MINKTTPTKSICAGMLGTAIEWYDYGLFGFLAPVIAELFFPANSKWLSLLQAFTVFAIGYFLRPLGGLIFGSIADRFGRVVALRSTILLISLPSILIACLPTYAQLGWISTFILILLRLLQGVSVGGEFAGSMVYLTEISPFRFKTLFSGLANNASNIGVLVGVGFCGLLTSLMSHENFIAIGWRIPFLVGGILGLVGFRLRKLFIESEVFLQLRVEQKLHEKPLKILFKQYKSTLILGILLCFMGACGIYTLTVFLNTYLVLTKQYSLAAALSLQSFLLILTLILVPIASLLANRYGKIPLLKIAALGNILYAGFAFAILPSANIIAVAFILLPLIIFISLEQGIMPATLSELFPTAIRYSAVSFSYNVSYAYIGGAAPMYLTWLINYFHTPLIPGIAIMLSSLVTGVALWRLK